MSNPILPKAIDVKKVGEKDEQGLYLVLNSESPSWMFVNNDGLEILNLCTGQNSVEAISRSLSEKYHLSSEDTLRIVAAFLEQARNNKVIYVEPTNEQYENPFRGIALEITKRCNLRCIHCYLCAGEPGSNELSLQEIKSLLDSLKDLGGTSLAVGGGEPLLRRDLYDILDHATSLDLMLSLGTNSTLITPETARKLSKYPLKIQVSLDGASAETNDRIRGPGSYTQAVSGIDNLIQQGLAKDMVISFTPMRFNLIETPAIVEFAINKRIPVIQFPPLSPSGRAKENWEEIAMSDQQVLWFWKFVTKRASELKGEMDLLADCFSINIENSGVPYRCSIGSQLRVDPDGNVYPCQCFHTGDEFILGNMRDHDLKSIVHGEKLRQTVKECFHRPLKITECKGCNWKNFCGAGCMGLAYESHGKTLTSDSCNVRKIWIERLFNNKVENILAKENK